MPFQSEKQRRYMHANLPKIAKRWERDYANGGISNHFRKKFDVGSEDSYGQLLDDWDAGFIYDALPGEDFTTYYNRIMKVENDTGTEDVELLNLLAENQDPLNLSEGVTTLFQAKEGGNVRLRPHKATDLLVKKTATGERPKYQPPGHRDAPAPSSRGPRDAPDRGGQPSTPSRPTMRDVAGPVKTITTTVERDDGGGDVYQDRIMQIAEQQKKTKEEREQASQEGWHQFITPKHKTPAKQPFTLGTALKWIAAGALIIGTGGAALGLGGNKIVQTAQLINKVSKLTKQATSAYNFINNTDYTRDELFNKIQEDAKAVKEERKDKMDLYESLPAGHPEKIALEIELEIGKKPDHLGDDGGTLPVSVPVVTEELEEATDEGAIDIYSAWDEIKRKQALNAQLQEKWAAEQEARDQSFIVANSGGLANLFRVKNQ
jgi:hypothetical protein